MLVNLRDLPSFSTTSLIQMTNRGLTLLMPILSNLLKNWDVMGWILIMKSFGMPITIEGPLTMKNSSKTLDKMGHLWNPCRAILILFLTLTFYKNMLLQSLNVEKVSEVHLLIPIQLTKFIESCKASKKDRKQLSQLSK